MENKKIFFLLVLEVLGCPRLLNFFMRKVTLFLGMINPNNRSIEILIHKGIGITNKLNIEEIPKEIMGDDVEIIYTLQSKTIIFI